MCGDRILTVSQMSKCEKSAEKYGVSLWDLMQNAGGKLSECIFECADNAYRTEAWGNFFDDIKENIVILAGKGNNGGDGLVAAKNLYEKLQIKTKVILCCGEPNTELSKRAFEELPEDIEVLRFGKDDNVPEVIRNAKLLVDCIFGTGFKGSLREDILPVFKACEENECVFKIACDIPSGCNADNGFADELSFKADFVATFHCKKVGHQLSPAKYFMGLTYPAIVEYDIGIPSECDDELDFDLRKLSPKDIRSMLPKRLPYAHKGTFGKVLAVCGSEKYIGAAGISTNAAMHSGVGLVELFTPQKVIDSVSSKLFECIYTKADTDKDGFIGYSNIDKILELSKKADCLLIGCGIGHTKDTEKLVMELIEKASCKIVLDADGINSLCPNIDVLQNKKSQVILTPHPAELSRLCNCTVGEVLENRLAYAVGLAEKYDVTVMSKSAETFIVDSKCGYISDRGNTALAKGGSGDMLAGMTASFIAQGVDLLESGTLASYIMGRTAELICKYNSARSVLAADIIEHLSETFKEYEE